MSDNKLPPENQRLLEILLEPGMREYMRESARKAFDIPKLKKWLEDGAPYEEEEEALVYREYKEREARKNDGSAGEVGEGSVGAIRCNYNNGGKQANGTAHRTYPNNEPKTGKTSSPCASTNNQHIGITYKNYQYRPKSFPDSGNVLE
ncbi:hypothetical protein RhiirA5_410473 [Rhizophagus irregularis]|uniref:Uncharacterized protein n=1 Tax=Rhizophagus irregularis TaxID=588596 RepID=A0A2N0SAC0_9GLOM|nr:hypothetical protein RhiirA5_410473 [Rhizophagus irregularis]PKC72497.1 hypothetical protein RhiirA1_452264 [Rhizophagus irregularis]CAB4471247.1 unnamed protein product [Rhizophagus irregularis]CAB5199883.1 unnamed protein product [Rhizophagus irregularis]